VTERIERSPRAILLAVAFAVFVAADDLTVVTTMLRPIINDLGLALPDGLDDAAWVVNAYLIAFVAIMPIAGRLSDVFGRRQVFVGAYAVFLGGTVLIPLSTTLGPFLLGRVLTAIGGGAMVPVALAVVGDVYPVERRSRALGSLAAIETFGWVWGPLYGAMLVRFFDWRTQFWLNIPLGLVGLVWVWWALDDHHAPDRSRRVDWSGAALLTAALVALDLALLGNAEVQSVTGLDQLRNAGTGSLQFRWLYLVAAGLGWAFVVHQREHPDPVLDRGLFAGPAIKVALAVNFVVGAGLVVAMVDVPIFVNAVELDLERSAVVAGWLLASMTGAMAIMSYVGGRLSERHGPRVPVVGGVGAIVVAFAWMGFTWAPESSRPLLALMLAVLGTGLGLTVAPTTSVVVDQAEPEKRGSAASTVMVVRLMGLSVGLAALTAWSLARFNELRGSIELPPLDSVQFQSAVVEAQQTLTADAIAETFLAVAAVSLVGFLLALRLRPVTVSKGERMSVDNASRPAPTERITRPVAVAAAAVGIVVAGIVVLGVMLVSTRGRLDEVSADLAQTQADLERVEAGSALFASQVQGFQEDLLELQPQVSAGLDSAIEGLETFRGSTLEFMVDVDETINIDTEVVIARTVDVPINTAIPIKETINTTIRVGTPLGFDVPVDVTVPVDLEVPIDLNVQVPIDETVPVSAEVPIQVSVPVTIEVSDTELAPLAESLAKGLAALQAILADLGG